MKIKQNQSLLVSLSEALTFIPDVGARVALKLSTVSLTDFSAPLFFHLFEFALPTNITTSSVPSGIVAAVKRWLDMYCNLYDDIKNKHVQSKKIETLTH